MLTGQALQAAAVELARAGMRPSLIAEHLGRNPATVSAALSHARAAGADVPRYPPGKPGPEAAARTQAQRDQMVALARGGHPPREVGAIVGRSAAHVSQQLFRLRRAGVDAPRTRPGRRGPD